MKKTKSRNKFVTLQPDLYECEDCFVEALLDIGHYSRASYTIAHDLLDRFNIAYRKEYKFAHIDQNMKIVNWRTEKE